MEHVRAAAAAGRAARWRVGAALFVVAYGTNVFTPLLVVYRSRLDLSAVTVTTIFAMYAAGLLPGLLFAGPLSDRVGRRRIVVPAAGLAGLVSLLFVPAAGLVPLLYTARFLQGIVTGAAFSVASAWLQDLTDRPGGAARGASLAMNSGFCIGPVVSGVLGQYGPAPLTLPFVVHAALVGLGVAVVIGVRDVTRERRTGRLFEFGVPAGTRGTFWLVLVPTAVCVFGFAATVGGLLPLLLPTGDPRVFETGVIGGATLGSAALVTPTSLFLRSMTGPIGVACGAVGFAFAAAAYGGHAVALLVAAAVMFGCGSGLTLTAGLGLAQRLSTERTRGALSSAFYAWAYAGFGLPVLITASANGGRLTGSLAVVAVVAVMLALWLAASARHGRPFTSRVHRLACSERRTDERAGADGPRCLRVGAKRARR